MNPDIVRQIERVLAERELTVIVLDPRVLERLRLLVGPEKATHLRGVLASDRETIARLDPTQPILISRPARERLEDIALPPQLAPGPVISPDSIEELIAALIRLNLEAMEGEAGRS